jgi:hypothetical protein
MLRARLLTSLVFNLVLAVWVLRDARARRARKPGFAAVLALMWGALALGFWQSDRPLRLGERRLGGTAWSVASGFLAGWAAMLPAVVVLALPVMRDGAVVPGSLGQQYGVPTATALVVAMLWGAPALLALALGVAGRRPHVERGTSAVPGASLPSWMAAALAGLAALLTALALTR